MFGHHVNVNDVNCLMLLKQLRSSCTVFSFDHHEVNPVKSAVKRCPLLDWCWYVPAATESVSHVFCDCSMLMEIIATFVLWSHWLIVMY
jgi:hypothetical protein